MPRYILKIDDDKYFEWSTAVDAPVTCIMSREQMKDYLLKCGMEELKMAVEDRLLRTDVNGSSACDSNHRLETLIPGNRAGQDEEELTLNQIIEQYSE